MSRIVCGWSLVQESDLGVVDLDQIEALVDDGKLDAAIAALHDVPPDDADAILYRAFLEQRRGDFGASVRTLEARIACAPHDGGAWLQRGYAHWLAGELVDARRDLAHVAAQRGGDEGDDTLADRAQRDRDALDAQIRELEPVAAAAAHLDSAFIASLVVVLLAVTVCAIKSIRTGS